MSLASSSSEAPLGGDSCACAHNRSDSKEEVASSPPAKSWVKRLCSVYQHQVTASRAAAARLSLKLAYGIIDNLLTTISTGALKRS